MTLTAAQQTANERPVAQVAYFVELAFAGGTTYWSTLGQTVTWGGHDWLGVDAIGGISEVDESDSIVSKPLNFTLNITDLAILALAVGDVDEYRGRSAKLYMCPLDANFVPIDTPVLCWTGIMDKVAVGVEDKAGQIILKCETAAFGLKRRPALRMNAAQHKKLYPSDTGFDYLNDMIANPQLWLSKRFQQQ